MPTHEEIDAQVADVTKELQTVLDTYTKELLAKFHKMGRIAMHAAELARLVEETAKGGWKNRGPLTLAAVQLREMIEEAGE